MNAHDIMEAARFYGETARTFRFSDHARRQIAGILGGNDSVREAEIAVFDAFLMVRDGRVAPPAQRRDKHLETADLVRRLVTLLRDGSLFGGGTMLAYLNDFPEAPDDGTPFPRQWIRALDYMRVRCEQAARTGELPGWEDADDGQWLVRFGGDDLRNEISSQIMRLYCSAGGSRPTAYDYSPAVQLLQDAVPPALKFAEDKLGYRVKGKRGDDLSISTTWAKSFIRAFNRNAA